MKAGLKFLILSMVAAAVAAGTTLILHFVHIGNFTTDMKYTDFVSITLTALGLMITVLGFFVAAAGVIGWTTLESKLRAHSVEYFTSQLDKNGPLRTELEQLFADIAYNGIEGLRDTNKEERPYSD